MERDTFRKLPIGTKVIYEGEDGGCITNGVTYEIIKKEMVIDDFGKELQVYDSVPYMKLYEPIPLEIFEDRVKEVTDSLTELLIAKNLKYGNSALEPKRIFSKSDAVEQIKVRIDDKLSRMANQDEDEDVVQDLLGYLILLKIAQNN